MRFVWHNYNDLNEAELREHLEISERSFMDEADRVREFRRKLNAGELKEGDSFLTTMAVEEHGWDRTGPNEVTAVDDSIQLRAIEMLKEQGEPTECGRCGGKPGDPGCGKVIHVVMDAVYEQARQLLAKKEEGKSYTYFCSAMVGDRDATLDEVKAAMEAQGLDPNVVEQEDAGCFNIPLTPKKAAALEEMRRIEFEADGVWFRLEMP